MLYDILLDIFIGVKSLKVFISWSGKRSKALANALKEWIPLIIQDAEPFVSDKDILAGDRWAQTIAGELETSNFGILCVTPENMSSEWILFEAGALSKAMQDAKVIPLLFGLELSGLSGPLSQFQALKSDKDGMLKTLQSINETSNKKTNESTIEKLVPALWPDFQKKLDAISDKDIPEKHARPQKEVLEDLVSQVRGLGSRMRHFDPEMFEHNFEHKNRKHHASDLIRLDSMMYMMVEYEKSDLSLLLLAGFVREQMPWLVEVLIDTHRELKTAGTEEALEIGRNLMQVVIFSTQSPWAARMMRQNRGTRILMKELPRLVNRVFSRQIKNWHIPEYIEEDDKVKAD